jgi:hypothetical protein
MGPRISEGLVGANPILWLAQVQGAAPPPSPSAHWVSYNGSEAIFLAIVLLAVAGGFAYAGRRLHVAFRVTRPGRTVAGFMIAIWLLSLYTVIVGTHVYAGHRGLSS